MFLRRSTTIKYFVTAIVGAVLYCEWAIYIIQPLYWNQLKCEDTDPTCLKILFVADPQIQGDTAVPPPLSYLFNWDSDRYLRSTFEVVMKQFKPDVLVFMGDLMDEGSIATVRQFHKYVKRLSDIFDPSYSVTIVWLPGDNDIGGENEPIKKDKVELFETIFYQPFIINFKNVSFYKVNGITHTYPKEENMYKNTFKIAVSHYPTTSRHAFAQEVNKAIRPNIYFCAHDHESRYVKQSKDLVHSESHRILDGDKPLQLRFDEDFLYEIYVPTCSYRMGTSHIGYGAAVLGTKEPKYIPRMMREAIEIKKHPNFNRDDGWCVPPAWDPIIHKIKSQATNYAVRRDHHNQHMAYTVFWSPTRFPYLIFYLCVVIILCLYFLIFCVAKLFHANGSRTKYNEDKLALLESM